MSQPDLQERLRESRPMAPAELREHVRGIAAREDAPPRRRRRVALTWRRALALAVPLAAVAAGAAILGQGGSRRASPSHPPSPARTPSPAAKSAIPGSLSPHSFANTGSLGAYSSGITTGKSAQAAVPAVPATSRNRVQRLSASLDLRVPNAQSVSEGAKRAQQITSALGGYASSLDVEAGGHSGYADLVLRIPKQNLPKAVARLSALGTITGEDVAMQDITAQVDATTRKIARLKAKLAAWQQQYQTTETQQHIAALTDEIGKLERGRKATVHAASYATLSLELTTRQAPTPPHHGRSRFHGLAVAFRWIGIGAVYALALGAPAVLVLWLVWLAARALRRRREETLLSRP